MKITFEERTAENENDATIHHCIYWRKDGVLKGELMVEYSDDTQSPIEFFGKSLDALKVRVMDFVLDMCDYEYKFYEDFEKFKTFENFQKYRAIEEECYNLRNI